MSMLATRNANELRRGVKQSDVFGHQKSEVPRRQVLVADRRRRGRRMIDLRTLLAAGAIEGVYRATRPLPALSDLCND